MVAALVIIVASHDARGIIRNLLRNHYSLLRRNLRGSSITSTRAEGDQFEYRIKPRFFQYAYLIVTYHKSGHALSHTLVNAINRLIEQHHLYRVNLETLK